MKMYDLIQVLWVEDDPEVTESFPVAAEREGIELVPFLCWDDALEALKKDYDRWSAIVLDAKCKQHRDSTDNAIRFLGEALKDISRLSEKKNRIIPWYILTGGDESFISDSINDDRDAWDSDWTESSHKKYYSKNTDTDILYKRIRVTSRKSNRLKVQELYKEVFRAMERCTISDDACNALEDLLIPIHFPNVIDEADYNDKFKKVRIILEYLFRSMTKHGLLPDFGPRCNLQWSSCLLGGKDACTKNGEIIVKCNSPVLPKLIAGIVKAMVNNVSSDVHSYESDDEIYYGENIPEFLKIVKTSNILKSYALQLCDIMLWYDWYLSRHGDEEINALNWDVLNEKKLKKS